MLGKTINFVKFWGFDVMIMKNAVFWDVTESSLLCIYRRFGGTSLNFYQSTQCHILERDAVKSGRYLSTIRKKVVKILPDYMIAILWDVTPCSLVYVNLWHGGKLLNFNQTIWRHTPEHSNQIWFQYNWLSWIKRAIFHSHQEGANSNYEFVNKLNIFKEQSRTWRNSNCLQNETDVVQRLWDTISRNHYIL
jgi:hypothetical protein